MLTMMNKINLETIESVLEYNTSVWYNSDVVPSNIGSNRLFRDKTLTVVNGDFVEVETSQSSPLNFSTKVDTGIDHSSFSNLPDPWIFRR